MTVALLLHRADGITWSILVSGDTPKESDDLRDMFDELIAKAPLDSINQLVGVVTQLLLTQRYRIEVLITLGFGVTGFFALDPERRCN